MLLSLGDVAEAIAPKPAIKPKPAEIVTATTTEPSRTIADIRPPGWDMPCSSLEYPVWEWKDRRGGTVYRREPGETPLFVNPDDFEAGCRPLESVCNWWQMGSVRGCELNPWIVVGSAIAGLLLLISNLGGKR